MNGLRKLLDGLGCMEYGVSEGTSDRRVKYIEWDKAVIWQEWLVVRSGVEGQRKERMVAGTVRKVSEK